MLINSLTMKQCDSFTWDFLVTLFYQYHALYIYNYFIIVILYIIIPDHGEVYSIQHYVIKLVSNLRQAGRVLLVPMFPLPINHHHDKTEILLKVALNTITPCIIILLNALLSLKLFGFPVLWFWAYLMKVILSVPDEGYFECTWRRLFWAYLMKVILSVPDEGYFERPWWRLFWAYLMKVIQEMRRAQ